MYNRLTILLFACLLFLPSCQHNIGDMFASKDDGPVDLQYGPGSVDLHTVANLMLEINGKKGQELPILSFDAHYVVKRSGSRLAWTMVLDHLKSLTSSPSQEPFYSVSFTTDAKGRNMADKVRHEVPGKDELNLGESVLSDIALPLEKVAVGEPSIKLPSKMLKSKDVEIVLPESSPAYIFDGVKEINGRQCYAFSYESKVTVRQNGEEFPGFMRFATVFSKQMLPVSDSNELTMNGPKENMVTKLVGSTREITAKDKAAAEAKGMRDLRAALKRAPLLQVTEPITFRYVPASVRLKAEATLFVGKKGKAGVNLPFMEYVMHIDTAEEGKRMAWNVEMYDLKLLGKSMDLPRALGFAFTTNEQGRDIRDFQDNTDTEILTVADIQSDFIIPEGAYKSGDVCMPVKMKGKSANLQYDFPEGEGFVFQGVKQVGSMRVGVFKADIDHFTAWTKKSDAVREGSLYIVRYYDLATMMPLWYDGKVVMDMEGGSSTLTTIAGMTRIMN